MQTITAFLALLLPLTLSPGPAAIALAGLGMRQGIVKSMPFYFGLLISVFAIAVASAFGLTAILLANADLYRIVRLAGIAYILYLGAKFLMAKPTEATLSESRYTLRDGMLLTALNPKFYALVVTVFSQFLGTGPYQIWSLIIGFTAVLAFSQLVWLSAGASLRPLMTSRKALRIQSVAFGLSLVAVGLYLLLG